MSRYQAPKHCSEIFTATGPKRPDAKGIITLAANAPVSDHHALRAAGCVRLADERAGTAAAGRTAPKAAKRAPDSPKA